MAMRSYQFFMWLRQRPEKEVVLATHSAWLMTTLNAVIECEHEDLSSWFLTGEMRSMYVTF
eukprot:scaffold2639_cov385-Prasinococcus_capsulatus_cf.AAC.3